MNKVFPEDGEDVRVKQARGGLDAYLNTVQRLEPEITPIDVNGAVASIAISLKRIADVMEWIKATVEKEIEKNGNNTQA